MVSFHFHIDQIDNTAQELLQLSSTYKIWKFEGGMGAGKTTLIAAVLLALGSSDQVSSPTFSLVNEYHYINGKVYHFDFYRIQSEQEALDLGIYDYLDSGNYCFIEWPSCIPRILKDEQVLTLQMEPGMDHHHRNLSIQFPT